VCYIVQQSLLSFAIVINSDKHNIPPVVKMFLMCFHKQSMSLIRHCAFCVQLAWFTSPAYSVTDARQICYVDRSRDTLIQQILISFPSSFAYIFEFRSFSAFDMLQKSRTMHSFSYFVGNFLELNANDSCSCFLFFEIYLFEGVNKLFI